MIARLYYEINTPVYIQFIIVRNPFSTYYSLKIASTHLVKTEFMTIVLDPLELCSNKKVNNTITDKLTIK